MTRPLIAALAAAILLSPSLGRAQAQRTLSIQRFHAAIRVDSSGDLEIRETITAKFDGAWNGLYRAIPVKYRTPQGFSWTVGLEFEGAAGEGSALRTETSREGHYLKYKIWLPGAVDAVKTIVLRYRVRNGLRFFDEHDELYWNVTGDEWDVPIEAASAVIELPPGAAGVRATAFNGVYGSASRDAEVDIEGRHVTITMPHRLNFREGLTAVVGWDKGLVPEPTAVERTAGFLRANWPLALPIPVFLLAFTVWRRRGRDPRQRPITVQYEPPARLTPAEAGTLLDHSTDMRDVTATLVDLCVRGYLKLEERDERMLFGLIGDREYVIHRLKPRPDWRALPAHEQRLLEGLFEDDAASVELSELKDEFYTSIDGIKNGIFDRLLERGYYRARPDRVQAGWVFAGVVLGVITAMGGGALSASLSMTPVPFIAAGVLIALTLIGFGLVMPARTEAGARTLEQVLGFEEFLRRVEKENFERVVKTPELFDRFLPFAMAFGVEQKWAKAFQGIYTQPPTWFVGSGPITAFNASHFSSRLADFSGRAGSTLSSSPRSSSGSGFSGGSSGGGGGGGGGGGF